jgi:hypothetical protein
VYIGTLRSHKAHKFLLYPVIIPIRDHCTKHDTVGLWFTWNNSSTIIYRNDNSILPGTIKSVVGVLVVVCSIVGG